MLTFLKWLIELIFGKRKLITIPEPIKPKPVVPPKEEVIHHDYVAPKITDYDKELLKQFLEENGNFEDFKYRKGAAFTANFGIENGWGPNMTPGYVRIHTGVDRANGGSITYGGQTINDIVISPMSFDASDFIDYKNTGYGSLVFLVSIKYQFDMRIGHMDPSKNIISWSLQQFKSKKPFGKNWYIGSAGTYGYSTGNHTHTEFVSHDEACEIFELILMDKYGDAVFKQYTDEEIISFYREVAKQYPNTSPFVEWKDYQILQNWNELKAAKQVVFINQYKMMRTSNGKPYTMYATNHVIKDL